MAGASLPRPVRDSGKMLIFLSVGIISLYHPSNFLCSGLLDLRPFGIPVDQDIAAQA